MISIKTQHWKEFQIPTRVRANSKHVTLNLWKISHIRTNISLKPRTEIFLQKSIVLPTYKYFKLLAIPLNFRMKIHSLWIFSHVWNDEKNSPHNRFFSLTHFLAVYLHQFVSVNRVSIMLYTLPYASRDTIHMCVIW